jgi:hypothetical protein
MIPMTNSERTQAAKRVLRTVFVDPTDRALVGVQVDAGFLASQGRTDERSYRDGDHYGDEQRHRADCSSREVARARFKLTHCRLGGTVIAPHSGYGVIEGVKETVVIRRSPAVVGRNRDRQSYRDVLLGRTDKWKPALFVVQDGHSGWSR